MWEKYLTNSPIPKGKGFLAVSSVRYKKRGVQTPLFYYSSSDKSSSVILLINKYVA